MGENCNKGKSDTTHVLSHPAIALQLWRTDRIKSWKDSIGLSIQTWTLDELNTAHDRASTRVQELGTALQSAKTRAESAATSAAHEPANHFLSLRAKFASDHVALLKKYRTEQFLLSLKLDTELINRRLGNAPHTWNHHQ